MSGGPVLLYDGACGLCAASVQFVLRHDRRRTLRFAALQGAFARAVLARHSELHGADSMVWIGDAASSGPISLRSDAVLRVLAYLGGPWALLAPLRLIPRSLRDSIYAVTARHRHRLGREACLIITPDIAARFLD